MKHKNFWTVVSFVGLAAVTYWIIFSKYDKDEIISAIRGIDTAFLAAAMALALVFVAMEGVIIWYLLSAVSKTARLSSCIRYSFIGFFFSGVTPSATGGQPMQLYYMNRDGNRLSDSAAVLMGVAVLYKLVLVLIGIAILFFWNGGLRGFLGIYLWVYYLGLFLNALLVVLLLAVMLFPENLKRVLFQIERFLIRFWVFKPQAARQQKIIGFVDGYRDTVDFFKTSGGRVAVAVLLTFFQRFCAFFVTYLVYRGFHLSGYDFLTIMMLRAAIYLSVDMLPLPGSQGITELMYGVVFGPLFTRGLLPAAICVTRAVDFYFPLCVSFLVLMGSKCSYWIKAYVKSRRNRIGA